MRQLGFRWLCTTVCHGRGNPVPEVHHATGFSDLPGRKLAPPCPFCLEGQKIGYIAAPTAGFRFCRITSIKALTKMEIQGRVCVRERTRPRGSCITYGELLFVYCLLLVVTLQRRERAAAAVLFSASKDSFPSDRFRFHRIRQY